MKKLLLSFIVSLVMLPAAFAQRHCDLQARLLSPDDNEDIVYDIPFQISVMITNHGTDTLRTSDTVRLSLIFDGFPIEFNLGSVNLDHLPLTNHELLPGDSNSFSMNFAVSEGWPTGPTNFCVKVMPANGLDSINDPVLSNNQTCVNLKVIDPNPQGIRSVSKLTPVIIYPNPAKDVANFELYLEKAGTVSVQLFDMTGKMLVKKDETYTQGGAHTLSVNTATLTTGTYFYKLSTGDKEMKGKLQVQ